MLAMIISWPMTFFTNRIFTGLVIAGSNRATVFPMANGFIRPFN
jgi:hypothetical protein